MRAGTPETKPLHRCRQASRWSMLAAGVFTLTTFISRPAAARFTQEFGYPLARTWQTVVRFVRVDMGYRVTDRDAESGYVVFEYDEAGHTYQGTFELFETTDHGVRIVVQMPQRASYHERVLVERLQRKLRDELGDPVAPRRTPTRPPNEDASEQERNADANRTPNESNNAHDRNDDGNRDASGTNPQRDRH